MRDDTAGLVLAGGLARRMGGGDKVLRPLGGRAMLDHVLASLRPQVAACLLNANGDPARFGAWGLPVAADGMPDFPGPLAGVLAGMDWVAEHRPDLPWLVSLPGDNPFAPPDLVARLHIAREAAGTPIACAASEAVPIPASRITGTVADSMISSMLWGLRMHSPEPIGAPSGITAAQPVASSLRARMGSSLVYGSTTKPSATSSKRKRSTASPRTPGTCPLTTATRRSSRPKVSAIPPLHQPV